jgi:acetylornithine deacetylase/succinyl-diaminopimelate desuccinylase-like protein
MRLSSMVLACCLVLACAPAPVASPSSSSASAVPTLEAERREILAELVSFDTSHGRETEALRPIARRLEAAGVHAEIFEPAPGRGTLVARLKGSGAKKPLLLMAHVDVVPVDGQPWTVPAFRATEKDGYLEKILATDRYLNALIHTTCVTTMLQASPRANVLPTTAEAMVNCRILPDETPEQVHATLERTIGDPAVAVTPEPRTGGVAPLTEIDAAVMDAVRNAATRWSGAAVYSTMLIGSSDSRVPTKWLDDGVRFLRDVVRNLSAQPPQGDGR